MSLFFLLLSSFFQSQLSTSAPLYCFCFSSLCPIPPWNSCCLLSQLQSKLPLLSNYHSLRFMCRLVSLLLSRLGVSTGGSLPVTGFYSQKGGMASVFVPINFSPLYKLRECVYSSYGETPLVAAVYCGWIMMLAPIPFLLVQCPQSLSCLTSP